LAQHYRLGKRGKCATSSFFQQAVSRKIIIVAPSIRQRRRIFGRPHKINFTQPLPVAYANRIRGLDGVAQLTHANWFGGYFQDPKNFLIVFAVEPDSYMDLYSDDLDFPAEARRAFVRDRSGAMVGETLARKWGWKVGDHIPITSSIFSQKNGARSWDFTIDGIFSSRRLHVDTNLMIFQYDYFDETRSFAKDMIGWIVLRTASPAMNDQVAKAVDKMFANSSYETSTDTEKAFNKAFAAQLGNIALIVELVVGAGFATILMIVGNSMVMAVRERTREIGVLKTLGFTGARVLRLVLGESILLALLGGIPGLLVALLVIWSTRDSLSNFVPGMTLTPGIALAAVALMIALGIVTGLVPALNAFRLRIAAALGRG
jgi:putative ABC transport system permease protein